MRKSVLFTAFVAVLLCLLATACGKKESSDVRPELTKTHLPLHTIDSQKVDLFLVSHQKYFKPEHIPLIKDRLLALGDDKFALICSLDYQDPTTILLVSIFGGCLGIDRMLVGDTGLGYLKIITVGGLGIWVIVDWFLIQGRTREQNYLKLLQVIG